MIPEHVDFPDGRYGERTVWEALRDQLPDGVVVWYSVPVLDGEREREVDLLVGWPGVGFAVVEVKGGHVGRDAQGWFSSGASGTRRLEDPVVQVQAARHHLTSRLHEHGVAAQRAVRARWVHMVALPAITVPSSWATPGCPRAIVLDQDDLDHAAERIKAAVNLHGTGQAPPDGEDVYAVAEAIAARLPAEPDPRARAREHETRADQLTKDQGDMLGMIQHWRRARIIGGAGTGKTWLATEQTRRLARRGERVALVCYSRGLARHLERQARTWSRDERPAYVGLFHELPVRWGAERGADDDSDYYETRLPRRLRELAAARPAEERFDAIVVDEAQDFSDEWWPALLACLRDEERGGLFVFLDDGQKVFPRQGQDPIRLDPFELSKNLRNTKPIGQLIGSMSPVPMTPRGLDGPPVRIADVPAEQALAAADDIVDALLDEGWEPGDVALITTAHRHPVQKELVEGRGWDAYWDEYFDGEEVFYGHVLGFKGLERRVVVLCVDGLTGDRARERLYTGMSRATSLLVLVGPRELVESVGGEGVRRRLASAQPM
ncbi:NERD domain-containing protein [Georgenia muralis]